jgi:hypothetical protein
MYGVSEHQLYSYSSMQFMNIILCTVKAYQARSPCTTEVSLPPQKQYSRHVVLAHRTRTAGLQFLLDNSAQQQYSVRENVVPAVQHSPGNGTAYKNNILYTSVSQKSCTAFTYVQHIVPSHKYQVRKALFCNTQENYQKTIAIIAACLRKAPITPFYYFSWGSFSSGLHKSTSEFEFFEKKLPIVGS